MSEYQELYKKYRPSNWDEIVGQEEVVSSLKASIKTDNLPSAYGFFGTHGCGKALHKDTLIPTPSGFKKMEDIEIGDYVLGSNSLPVEVTNKYCPYDPTAFKLHFDDDTEVKASGGHLWTVSTFAGSVLDSAHNTLTTKQMYEKMQETHGGLFTISVRTVNNENTVDNESTESIANTFAGVFEDLGVGTFDKAIVDVDSYMAEVSDGIEFDAKANSYLFKINSWATELDSKVAIMRALGGIVLVEEVVNGLEVDWFAVPQAVVNNLALINAKEEEVFVNRDYPVILEHFVTSIEEIEDERSDYYCISVDAEDELFLCTESFIPTHNTSTAKILAKAINCTALEEDLNPCGVCENCVSIANDSSLDVFYESMANAGGAENIRSIMDNAEYEPRGKKGVFILDEVHNLSKAAFDAMLIPLEKENSPSVFILCSTEPEKIPKTIHSRIQGRNFQKIDNRTMFDYVNTIANKENIVAEKELLQEVVRKGKGSVRDTLKFLEEVRSGNSLSNATLSESEFSKDIFKTVFSAKSDFACMSAVLKIVDEADKETSIESLLHQLFRTARKTIVNMESKGKNTIGTRDNAFPVLRDMMVFFGEAIDKCNMLDGVEERFYLESALAQLLAKHPLSTDSWGTPGS